MTHGDLTAAAAAQEGSRHIAELTGKEVSGVVSVQPAEDGWLVGVEVVEDHRVPATSDLLALYEAQVTPDGALLSYRRRKRYARGRMDAGEGG